MTTFDDVRRMALDLPETCEIDHFDAPSFRVGKAAFAVLREPGQATLRFEPDDQHNLVAAHPGLIEPVSGGKRNDRAGREGWSLVSYEAFQPDQIAGLLKLAWSGVAPKRLHP
jgi:hypothetical protein